MVASDVVIAALIGGIGLGFVFSLTGTGFYLVFKVLDILNIAHGIYVVFAAYTIRMLTLYGLPVTGTPVGLPVAISIAILFSGVLGYIVQRTIFTPLIQYTGSGGKEIIIVGSFGLVFAFEQIWGNLTLYEPVSNSLPISFPQFSIGNAEVDTMFVALGLFSLVVVLLFHHFLNNTMSGKIIKSIDQNEMGARISGISVERTYNRTHLLCGLLTGLAGVLLGFLRPIETTQVIHWTVFSFIVVMVGTIISPDEEKAILSMLIAGPLMGSVVGIVGRIGYAQWMDYVMFIALLALILVVNFTTRTEEVI